jgi:hypothetical protein
MDCKLDRVGVGHELDLEPNITVTKRIDLDVEAAVRKRFGHFSCRWAPSP